MKGDNQMEVKQVIVVREDLNLSIGKLAVQVAHASLEASEIAKRKDPKIWRLWRESGSKKVVVKCKDLNELNIIYKKALQLSLPVTRIQDAGLTEVPPGTVTAVGIGPYHSNLIDKVTGSLPLL